MRDTTIFYRSFYEAIKELDPQHQQQLYNGIFEYSLDFKEQNFTGVCKTVWTLIKPQLDANLKRFENGSKPKVKQTKSEIEAKQKQEESKTEANNNNNVNNNKKNNKNITLDFSFCNENLVEDIKSFVEFRKSIKKPFTTQDQLERLYNQLKKYSNNNVKVAKEIVNQSIVNGWQGIFELKETIDQKPKEDPQVDKYGKPRPSNQYILLDGKWTVL
jgi:hypothetical protein